MPQELKLEINNFKGKSHKASKQLLQKAHLICPRTGIWHVQISQSVTYVCAATSAYIICSCTLAQKLNLKDALVGLSSCVDHVKNRQ